MNEDCYLTKTKILLCLPNQTTLIDIELVDINMIIKLIINIVEMDVIIRLMISMVDGVDQADNEGCKVKRPIGSNQRHHFYGNGSYINRKYFWENHQNNTGTQKPKQNQFIGRGGMNIYDAGVIGVTHYNYIPYNACFTGMHCIIPLFR